MIGVGTVAAQGYAPTIASTKSANFNAIDQHGR